MELSYRIASSPQEFREGARLFRIYAESISIDLSFQQFDDELRSIDLQYSAPSGALLLCYFSNEAIACVGLRQIDTEIAELKRMYVSPQCRGKHIGSELLVQIIGIAKQFGYRKIRLDTLPTMHEAQALYRSHGFYEIPPYRFNPVPGTIYMEKLLA